MINFIEFEDGKNPGSCYLYYDDQLLGEEQAIFHLQQDNFQELNKYGFVVTEFQQQILTKLFNELYQSHIDSMTKEIKIKTVNDFHDFIDNYLKEIHSRG